MHGLLDLAALCFMMRTSMSYAAAYAERVLEYDEAFISMSCAAAYAERELEYDEAYISMSCAAGGVRS